MSLFLGLLRRSTWFGMFLGAALVPAAAMAAEADKAQQAPADAKAVEMFEGIRKGDIAVKFVPRDSRQARVWIENKTKQPLNVKLPEAFAGVPVLAQLGGGGLGGGGVGGRGAGGGGGMQGMGGGFGGGGMFYVAPEKVGELKVPTVCLEHGKKEPRPSAPYEIRPIESFTDKAEVRELCSALGRGEINQRVAQAAAWHLNSGMSWMQLAAKQQRRANNTTQPYFTAAEIQAAMQATTVATQAAQARQQTPASASAN